MRWQDSQTRLIETNIYVIKSDGSGERRLTIDSSEEADPAWSPDGKDIVFSSDRDSPDDEGSLDLYLMRSDGSEVRRITETEADEHSPDWSPDGERIVYGRSGADLWDVWVMNADGTEQQRLTAATAGQPTWSPDGAQIAFVCPSKEGGSDEICLMPSGGGTLSGSRRSVTLVNDSGDVVPAVVP